MEDLKQGTNIKYDVQTLKGEGKIVGIASNELPIIGKLYIIEPNEPINSDVYNYTHFVAYENQIEIIK